MHFFTKYRRVSEDVKGELTNIVPTIENLYMGRVPLSLGTRLSYEKQIEYESDVNAICIWSNKKAVVSIVSESLGLNGTVDLNSEFSIVTIPEVHVKPSDDPITIEMTSSDDGVVLSSLMLFNGNVTTVHDYNSYFISLFNSFLDDEKWYSGKIIRYENNGFVVESSSYIKNDVFIVVDGMEFIIQNVVVLEDSNYSLITFDSVDAENYKRVVEGEIEDFEVKVRVMRRQSQDHETDKDYVAGMFAKPSIHVYSTGLSYADSHNVMHDYNTGHVYSPNAYMEYSFLFYTTSEYDCHKLMGLILNKIPKNSNFYFKGLTLCFNISEMRYEAPVDVSQANMGYISLCQLPMFSLDIDGGNVIHYVDRAGFIENFDIESDNSLEIINA